MTTNSDSSDTIRERARARHGRARAPVLLLSSFISKSARVVSLKDPVTIGRGRMAAGAVRSQDREVILQVDRTLSRPHLRIAPSATGRWQVEDLGSTNGTFVDGRRVKKPAPLADGSIVLFGCHAGVFRHVSPDELAAIEAEAAHPFGPVATMSPALAVTVSALRRLARGGRNLLLVGETGVGKEIYARAVHQASGRRGDFVPINCGALPAELAESELFGFARGAHSTATRAKPGLVELAHKGTLLLDEIGEMEPRLQAKLLRFLEDGRVMPLGSTRVRTADVAVIAATSQAPESLRADLVGRLGAEPIVIPPLRDRAEDIGALAAHFGAGAAAAMEAAAFRGLCMHAWPRNVRELREAVGSALALADGRKIRVDDLPGALRGALKTGPRIAAPSRQKWRRGPDRAELEELLRDHRGNVSAVARALGRNGTVVWRWIKEQQLEAERYRE
jgi:transcriptional regulator with PAS, ATPase and Fis domain